MSEELERPSQLKRGFNRLARDLDRAYALARLSPAQALVLQAVRDESWRYRKEEPDRTPTRVRPNLSGLARISGFNRSGLSTQLQQLVRRRLLIGDPRVGVEPNKDYRRWLNCRGQRLLTDAQIKWCLRHDRKGRGVELAQHAGAVNSTPPVENLQHAGAVNSTPLLSQLNTPVENFQQSRTTVARAGRTFKNLQDIRSAEDNHQERADVDVAVAVEDRLRDLAEALGPTQDLAPQVSAWLRSYSADWVESALYTAHANNPGRIAQYANGCLRSWKASGGPPRPEANGHPSVANGRAARADAALDELAARLARGEDV